MSGLLAAKWCKPLHKYSYLPKHILPSCLHKLSSSLNLIYKHIYNTFQLNIYIYQLFQLITFIVLPNFEGLIFFSEPRIFSSLANPRARLAAWLHLSLSSVFIFLSLICSTALIFIYSLTNGIASPPSQAYTYTHTQSAHTIHYTPKHLHTHTHTHTHTQTDAQRAVHDIISSHAKT